MFTPNTSIKCEKEMQFDRIPEIYFDEANNLCESDSHLRYNSQTVPYCKSFSFIENVNSKSGQCDYYFKSSMSGQSSNYEKFKIGKTSFGKSNSNLTVNNHDMMNIAALEDTIHYPMDESINYEFDVPMSLAPKEKGIQLANVNDEIDDGNFTICSFAY